MPALAARSNSCRLTCPSGRWRSAAMIASPDRDDLWQTASRRSSRRVGVAAKTVGLVPDPQPTMTKPSTPIRRRRPNTRQSSHPADRCRSKPCRGARRPLTRVGDNARAVNERPTYRPWLWGDDWPLVARWAKGRPDRVAVWYAASAVLAVGVTAWAAVTGWLFGLVVGAVVLVWVMADAGVHVPRARRAIQDQGRPT